MVQDNTGTPVFGRRKQPPGAAGAPPPAVMLPQKISVSAPAAATDDLTLKPSLSDERPSNAILDLIRKSCTDARGAHAESMLSALGAVAGFAAQKAIWSLYVRPGKLGVTTAFRIFEAGNGENFFFGDLLRTVVGSTKEGELSVWKLVREGALQAGAEDLPPIDSMFAHAQASAGTPDFGKPCWAKGYPPLEPSRDALNRLWPQAKARLAASGCEEGMWPLEVALAAQTMIVQLKGVINPVHAALAVMDAAIPMSSIDPLTVPDGR